MVTLEHAQNVLHTADQLYSAEQVAEAIQSMAEQINARINQPAEAVLAMPVMNGGLVLGGRLIPQLHFPLQIDYLHATRYRNTTQGSQLEWKVEPQHDLKGRTLLVIDDIFDEGYTLASVVEYCRQQGAAEVLTAVLVEKRHPRQKAPMTCDFIGLSVEDRYVFGSGMDYRSYHRNLDGIYAVSEDAHV